MSNPNIMLQSAHTIAVARGGEWQPKDSPTYAAIRAAVAATEPIQGLLTIPETEAEQQARFTAAASHFLGCRVDKQRHERILSKPRLFARGPVAPLPSEFYVTSETPIRNQLSCGSCWDFSAISTVEGAAITAGLADNSLNLSEQEVLSCGQNGGCNGDWPSTALKYAMEKGIPHEADVPYRANSGNGQCYNGNKRVRIAGYAYIGDGSGQGVPSDDDIKTALITYKCPVSVAVAVDNAWASYGSGIFNGTLNNPNYINHAVNIVGWKTVNGRTVWKVRNSWGTQWGDGGYMWTYSGSNMIGYGSEIAWCDTVPPNPVPPVPPSPPVPPPTTPKTFDVTVSGLIPTTFGNKPVTLKGVAVERVAGGVKICEGCDSRMPLGWSWEGFKVLLGDIHVLLMSNAVDTIEDAVLALYTDIREGKYGDAVAVALSTWPAVMALIGEVKKLIEKHRVLYVQATNQFNGGLAVPTGKFLDWLAEHADEIVRIAEIISRFIK